MTRPPDSLPPAPKLIWYILYHNGPLTPSEISERFDLEESTVYHALKKLEDHTEKTLDPDHAGRRFYDIDSKYWNETEVKET